MKELKRFGVSLEKELLFKFDNLLKEKGYTNRSEAIRDLIREDLVRKEIKENGEVVGAITIVYNHNQRELVYLIMDIQHSFHHNILGSLHIHLDNDNCLEIIAASGKASDIEKLANRLKATKGIKHTTLSITTKGRGF